MVKHPNWFGKKVAWITSGGPVELSMPWESSLFTQKIMGRCAEHFGCLSLYAKRPNIKDTPRSLLLCTHGYWILFHRQRSSWQASKPDFLVCGNNICGTVIKWYEIQARAFKVPLFFFDTPFIYDELYDHTLNYVQKQDERIYSFLETQLKRPFPEKRFRISASVRMKQSLCGKRFLICLGIIQPPWQRLMLSFTCSIVTLRGTTWASAITESWKKKWRKSEKGVGAFARWGNPAHLDNIPIWYDIRNLSQILSSQGAVLVADTYTSAWGMEQLDLAQTLTNGLARFCTDYTPSLSLR